MDHRTGHFWVLGLILDGWTYAPHHLALSAEMKSNCVFIPALARDFVGRKR